MKNQPKADPIHWLRSHWEGGNMYPSVHSQQSQSSLAQFLLAQLYLHSSLLFPASNEIRKGKENDFLAEPHKQVLKVQLIRDNTRRATHSMFPHALQYRQTDRNMGREPRGY